jgi:hypothetical protein
LCVRGREREKMGLGSKICFGEVEIVNTWEWGTLKLKIWGRQYKNKKPGEDKTTQNTETEQKPFFCGFYEIC